jgi:hypothetical protein
LKVGIILAVLIVYALSASLAYAEEFDIRFLPSKLVENSQGRMHVFVAEGGQIIPKKINDLTVTSLDSSILHIEKVEQSDAFSTEIIVKSGKPGTTTLYLAAPGFTSKEIPVTIYGNKNNAATLLVKITPDTFTTSGNREGYISVELADEDGFPVVAKEDTTISLSTANRDIVELSSSSMIIKKGEYFVYDKFQIKKSGEAVLYATAPGIQTQSSTVTVEKDEDLTVKLYTYPETISIHDASRGFIIAQLQDSSGSPVLAQNDITVFYKVVDSDYSEATNYSTNYEQKSSGYFHIVKGSYWGYIEYSLPKGLEDTYDLSISTADPLTVEEIEIEAEDLELMDDKLVKFESVPVLATGNRELIGIVYLEDEDGNPVVAKNDMTVKMDSSDAKSLSVEDAIFSQGDQMVLVYGKVGHSVSTSLDLRPVVKEGELESVTVFGPDKDSLELVAEPLITDVLAGTSFPMVLYLKDSEQVTSFLDDADVFLSPNEYVEIQKKKILQKDGLVVVDAKSLKKGSADLSVEVGDFKAEPTIDSLSSDPVSLVLDHSKTMFVGNNDVLSVQLLNSEGLPTYATNDVEVNLVVKDQGILEAPAKVTIGKGSYYSLFDVAPKASGKTDVSLLSKELPLLKKEITVASLALQLGISAPDSVDAAESFIAKISAKVNEKPLVGVNVQWKVDGGVVQISDSRTGTTGEAIISIIPRAEMVSIEAVVSGEGYPASTVTKRVQINSDTAEVFVEEQQAVSPEYEPFEVFGIDPVLIIVPGAIGAAGFMLKKKGQLAIKK